MRRAGARTRSNVRPRLRIPGLLLPGAVAVGILLALDPGVWFKDAIPAMTDLPGHLLPPTVLADELLPRWRLQGWSFDWFAGFPLYRFYFPLPGLLIAGLGQLIGGPLALRVVTAAPIILLPWALWAFARLARLGSASAWAVVVGSSSVLMISHTIMGGNIPSAAAGEFSYQWSLIFVLAYLGFLASPAPSRRFGAWAGVALSAAVLSHVVPAMIAAIGTFPLLLRSGTRARLLTAWAVTGLLTAFWFLPMVSTLGYVASPKWTYAPSLEDIAPLELTVLLPGAAFALLSLRRDRAIQILAMVGLAALAFAMTPQGLVMRARPLPIWYLAAHVLTGVGIARAFTMHRARGGAAARLSTAVGTVSAALWVLVTVLRGVHPSVWSATMEGVPERPASADLEAMIAHLAELPPGRIHWEVGDKLLDYGGEHTLGLLPLRTHHTTLSGLLRESAVLYEFLPHVDEELARNRPMSEYPRDIPGVPWAPGAAVERLRMLGVRYLLAHDPETSAEVERAVGAASARYGDLRLFDLGTVPLAQTLECWVAVPPADDFRQRAATWHQEWKPGAPTLIRGMDGVSDGLSADGECDADSLVARPAEVVLGPDRIRLITEWPGVPHLIRISYFPDWRLRDGQGPYLASPWFMVVVPEGRDVTLEYAVSPAEKLGLGVTLAGIVLLVAAARRRRARRDADSA